MTDNEYKFWVFLSYSHQDNREKRTGIQEVGSRCWGNWLHDALKTFSIPAEFVGQINGRGEIIPERIDPVFRDEQELPEAAALSEEIRKALEQSRCLIVICSPRSAKSLQVNEVVRHFKQLGRGKHILPIVVAGEPNAGTGNKTGASPEDECFVPALRHPVRRDGTLDATRQAGKSIFVDARHGAEKREVLAKDHRNAEADLEMAKIQLIALLLGVGFNGLWWREQKRHFLDFAEAQRQAMEALNQVEEVRRQLQEAQRQTREAQNKALEAQDLPPNVLGQIQEAQNQALTAQRQAREAQEQVFEFQNRLRNTQNALEDASRRAIAAEGRVLEAQNQAREIQNQLAATLNRTHEAQNQQSQLEETRNQVQKIQNQGRNARLRTRVFALLAALALLAAGIALRQRNAASQALAKAAAEAAGKYDLASGGLEQDQFRQVLQNIGGAEQAGNRRRSLDQLAAGIPRKSIPEALKAASVIVDDQQRSHFQKGLLVRLGWVNPMSAMTNASAIEGNIVNDAGVGDSCACFQLAVLDNWMKTDLPGAFRWVCQLPATGSRQRCLGEIIHWVQSQPVSDSAIKALATGIDELANTDVPGALAMAESLPEGAWRRALIARIWMKADPFATWNWIYSLVLPPDIMQPRKATWLWARYPLDADLGDPTMIPAQSGVLIEATNAPIQINPKE